MLQLKSIMYPRILYKKINFFGWGKFDNAYVERVALSSFLPITFDWFTALIYLLCFIYPTEWQYGFEEFVLIFMIPWVRIL